MSRPDDRGERPEQIRRPTEDALRRMRAAVDRAALSAAPELAAELRSCQNELEQQLLREPCIPRETEESRRRSADLLDSVPIGYFTLDPKSLILQVNLAGARLLGVDRHDLLNRPFYHYVTRRSRDEFFRHLRQQPPANSYETWEMGLTRGDGAPLETLAEGTSVPDDSGKVKRLRLALIDITDRKATEGRLRDSEELFRGTAENVPDGLLVMDDQHIIYANERACEILGLTKEELPNLKMSSVIPPEERTRIEAFRTSISEARAKLAEIETWINRKDGTRRYVLARFSSYRMGDAMRHLLVVTDVTDRKRDERTIRESEARFRALFEGSPIAIGVARERELLYVNPAYARMFGLADARELEGTSLLELIAPDRRDEADERVRRRARGSPPPADVESVGQRKDGTQFPFAATIAEIRLNDGPAQVVFLTDLTERRKAEEALRASEERFRSMIEQSPVPIGIAREGRISYVNAAHLRLFGYSGLNELVGTPILDGIVPRERGAVSERIQALAASREKRVGSEMTGLRKDGSEFPFAATAAEIQLADGPALIVFFTDLTERRRAEEALRENERKYRTLAETSPDMIYVVTPVGSITYVNSTAAKQFGAPPSAIEGRRIDEVFPPDAARQHMTAIRRVAESGQPFWNETHEHFPAGDRWIDAYLSPIRDEHGTVIAIQGVSRDITERRQAEAALRESEEKYRNVVERATDGIIIVQDGIIRFVNQSAAAMDHSTIEDVVGTRFTDHVSVEELPRITERYRRRMSGEVVPDSYRTAIRRRDGTQYTVDVNAGVANYRGRPADLLIVRDMTERVRTEEILNENRQQLAEAEHIAHVGSWSWNLRRNESYWSDELYRIVGLEPQSLPPTQATFVERIHPDDVAGYRRAIAEAEARRGSYSFDLRIIRPGGDVRWLHGETAAKYDEDGKEISIVGICQDVTELRAAENARCETEGRFRALLDNASDAILQADVDGHLIDANRAAERLLGYRREDLSAMSIEQIHPPAEAARIWSAFKEMEQSVGGPFTTVVLRRDGSTVPVEITGSAVEYQGKRIMQGVFRDISDRLRAEQVLIESEANYRTAIDAMIDAVHVMDANLRIILTNRAMTDWLKRVGVDPNIVGLTLYEAFPFLPGNVAEEYRTVLREGKILRTEECNRLEGRSVYTETRKAPVFLGSSVVRVMTVIRDITERKKAGADFP